MWSCGTAEVDEKLRMSSHGGRPRFKLEQPPPADVLERLGRSFDGHEGLMVVSSSARLLPVHKHDSPPYWNAVYAHARGEDAGALHAARGFNTLLMTPGSFSDEGLWQVTLCVASSHPIPLPCPSHAFRRSTSSRAPRAPLGSPFAL